MTIQELERDAKLRSWAAAIGVCKGSGKSVTQWCKENGVNEKTYYYRHRKVCEALGKDFSVKDLQGRFEEESQGISLAANHDSKWIPIELTAAEPAVQTGNSSIRVHIGKYTLDIEEGTSLVRLTQVVKALESIC